MKDNDNDNDTYEFFLNELRQYKLEEVAEEAELHFTTLYMWCSGKIRYPRLENLIKVARVIGLKVSFQRQEVQLRAVA